MPAVTNRVGPVATPFMTVSGMLTLVHGIWKNPVAFSPGNALMPPERKMLLHALSLVSPSYAVLRRYEPWSPSTAWTKPCVNGCGFPGLDCVCGTKSVAIKNGCPGHSGLSRRSAAGARPHRRSPRTIRPLYIARGRRTVPQRQSGSTAANLLRGLAVHSLLLRSARSPTMAQRPGPIIG
jgi:hypothetical protein